MTIYVKSKLKPLDMNDSYQIKVETLAIDNYLKVHYLEM